MDTQIRVLELEKELEQNRTKLLALRRQHYQLAGESEGWVSFILFLLSLCVLSILVFNSC